MIHSYPLDGANIRRSSFNAEHRPPFRILVELHEVPLFQCPPRRGSTSKYMCFCAAKIAYFMPSWQHFLLMSSLVGQGLPHGGELKGTMRDRATERPQGSRRGKPVSYTTAPRHGAWDISTPLCRRGGLSPRDPCGRW